MSALRKPEWIDEAADAPEPGSMAFLDHLDELRQRLIACTAAWIVGLVIAYVFSARIQDVIMRPLRDVLPPGSPLVFTDPAGGFVLQFRIAAIAGTFLASPFLMLQVWRFVAPGLYRDEKRLAIPFVVLSSLLFIAGASFSHVVAFPMAMAFFASFSTDVVRMMPEVERTFGMYVRMLFAFALAFQLPVVVMFLARVGIVTARFLVRHTRYAVLVVFILAAVLTPGGDVYVQLLMAAPMLVLYALAIGLAWIVEPARGESEIPGVR